MLGVADYPLEGPADLLLKEYGEELGVGDTYKHTRVGAYFGEPGKTVPDPYFGGEGPERSGCIGCGSCMVGCRHNAKNTLRKNYLWFAEKLGVEIIPERQVTDIRPLDGARTARSGYEVTSEHSGAWFRKRRSTLTARRRGRRGGRARHQPAAAELPPPRLAAAALGPARRPGPHQQRVGQRRHGARRRPRVRQVGRDQLQHLPRPRHPRRGRHLRRAGRHDELPVHLPDRRGRAREAAAALARRRRCATRSAPCACSGPASGRGGR